jgi:hypothetical protein
MRLAGRIARRNHLYLFAWLCALALPLGLQLLSGSIEEVRDYLDYYYGALSLWMFFSMTFGFATVFCSYYLVSSYRRSGTLDLLRVSGVTPWDVVSGIYLQILKILIPPMLAFAVLYACYSAIGQQASFGRDISTVQIASFALSMLVNMSLLAVLPCLVVYREEGPLALLALMAVLPVNAGPIIFLYVLHWPAPVYLLMLAGLLAGWLALSTWNLGRLWPPQVGPGRR